MNPFEYIKAKDQRTAVVSHGKAGSAQYIAGGTNLVDLMKKGVAKPQKLIDITGLPLKEIVSVNGNIKIGALVLNSTASEDKNILRDHPLLSLALKAGASPQLRNMATMGGNMLQRTRCSYFYDVALPCNKREPGTGCSALQGYNRMHAIFGHNDKCIAVHPSDMCVALVALDAVVTVTGTHGLRKIKFSDFHKLPVDNPEKDNTLQPGELILSIDIPAHPYRKHIDYLKVRDRASYAFALISVGAALDISSNIIKSARLAMGGVAHKPWRLFEAEKYLAGKSISEANFRQAAEMEMHSAKAFEHNRFKLKMAPNAIVEALKMAAAKT